MNTEHVLAKAVETVGFRRVKFKAADIPASFNNISIITIFGDDRGMYQFGTYLFPILSRIIYPSKYTVVCSYPGFDSLFPGANEYWAMADRSDELFSHAFGYYNKSSRYVDIVRSLNYWFEGQITQESLAEIHDGKLLTATAIERSGGMIPMSFPEIPPLYNLNNALNEEIARRGGSKVFLRPKKILRNRIGHKEVPIVIPKNFWVHALQKIVDAGLTPVIPRGGRFADLSHDLPECVHIETNNELLMMSVARECGVVLDFGGEDSRFAMTARTPYVSMTERNLFETYGFYELDDLANFSFPRRYALGSFPIMTNEGVTTWDNAVIKPLLANLKLIGPKPLPAISADVQSRDYGLVRKKLSKRMGTRFIKVEKV